jgi:hypothetical protein
MALRTQGASGVDISHPVERRRGIRSMNFTNTTYNWSKPKRLVIVAVGLDQGIYPGITRTGGEAQ